MMGCIIPIYYIYIEYKMEHTIIDITNQLDIFQKTSPGSLGRTERHVCVCVSVVK